MIKIATNQVNLTMLMQDGGLNHVCPINIWIIHPSVLQSQTWAGGEPAEESHWRREPNPWVPDTGDEAETHPGCGGAHRAAGAVQTSRATLFHTVRQNTNIACLLKLTLQFLKDKLIWFLIVSSLPRWSQTWRKPNRLWRRRRLN